jgi:hypothetical protein
MGDCGRLWATVGDCGLLRAVLRSADLLRSSSPCASTGDPVHREQHQPSIERDDHENTEQDKRVPSYEGTHGFDCSSSDAWWQQPDGAVNDAHRHGMRMTPDERDGSHPVREHEARVRVAIG